MSKYVLAHYFFSFLIYISAILVSRKKHFGLFNHVFLENFVVVINVDEEKG